MSDDREHHLSAEHQALLNQIREAVREEINGAFAAFLKGVIEGLKHEPEEDPEQVKNPT